MKAHYSVEFCCDDDGWWHARCRCGWAFGAGLPDAEDAADALMEHAYEQGVKDAADSQECKHNFVIPGSAGDYQCDKCGRWWTPGEVDSQPEASGEAGTVTPPAGSEEPTT